MGFLNARRFYRFFFTTILVYGLSNCAIIQRLSRGTDVYHTVTYPGETLGLISRWYTGSQENWKLIEAHNPVIKTDRIYIGQQIRIPAPIVINKNVLTREFVIANSKAGKPYEGISKGSSKNSSRDSFVGEESIENAPAEEGYKPDLESNNSINAPKSDDEKRDDLLKKLIIDKPLDSSPL